MFGIDNADTPLILHDLVGYRNILQKMYSELFFNGEIFFFNINLEWVVSLMI